MAATRTVNDAIVEAFTLKSTRQFEADRQASHGTAVMRRGAHPKHHGLVAATFRVRPDVPRDLRIGLFARERSFDALIRFSNAGRELEDKLPDAHGMAIKVHGAGSGLVEDEKDTQDFVLVDSPVFIARSPEDFLEFLFLSGKLAAASNADKPPIAAEIASKFPQVLRLKKVIQSPLTVPYWSQVPFALGSEATVKYKAVPTELDLSKPDGEQDKDYLRLAMRRRLGSVTPVIFDFMVQVRMPDMPLDDPTDEWSELTSPFVSVATIEIPPQEFESADRMTLAENIVYSPWHARPEHRPLGRVNESRREVYLRMQEERHAANRVGQP